jgi:hypothetical protein
MRDTNETTVMLVAKARQLGCEAIAEAILCANAALEAKEILGPTGFLKWAAKFCPAVKIDDLLKYMRLARSSKTTYVSYFKDCTSLRQAYILVGIIPEITPGDVTQDSPPDEAMRQVLGCHQVGIAVPHGTPARSI